jgi:hypothetical protein
MTSVGAGFSWGNEYGYVYIMIDPLFYLSSAIDAGVGCSVGTVLYESKNLKTNIEATQRIFDTGHDQVLFSASEHYRSSQNTALSIAYDYVEKYHRNWDTVKFTFDYYF